MCVRRVFGFFGITSHATPNVCRYGNVCQIWECVPDMGMCARYGNEESTLQTRAERTYFNACPIQSVLPSPLSVHIEYRSHSLAVHV